MRKSQRNTKNIRVGWSVYIAWHAMERRKKVPHAVAAIFSLSLSLASF